MNKKILWVTWESQRRNESIASALGVPLYVFDFKDNRIIRYVKCAYLTFKLFVSQKPDLVFCQNPSVVLALFSLLYMKLGRGKVCIDTHNAGLAIDGQHWVFRKLGLFLQRNADLIIVTNSKLKKMVEANGGKAFVLPDNIPVIEHVSGRFPFQHANNLTFICTYAADEPYQEVFKAAEIIESKRLDIGIYVTGKIPEHVDKSMLSKNTHLLGFVAWEDFDLLLHSSDGIIDLTTRENCLVCGAYEAVSVNTPGILSDTEALREYFNLGFRFTNNESWDLAEKIIELVEDVTEMRKEIGALKISLTEQWQEKKTNLLQLIDTL